MKNNPTKHFFDNDICDSDPFCNEKRKGREDVCSHMSMSCLRCDSLHLHPRFNHYLHYMCDLMAIQAYGEYFYLLNFPYNYKLTKV